MAPSPPLPQGSAITDRDLIWYSTDHQRRFLAHQRRFLAITCTKHLCDGLSDQSPNLFGGPLLKWILLLTDIIANGEHFKTFDIFVYSSKEHINLEKIHCFCSTNSIVLMQLVEQKQWIFSKTLNWPVQIFKQNFNILVMMKQTNQH